MDPAKPHFNEGSSLIKTTEEQPTEELPTGEPPTEEPSIEEPSIEEPSTKELPAEEPTTEELKRLLAEEVAKRKQACEERDRIHTHCQEFYRDIQQLTSVLVEKSETIQELKAEAALAADHMDHLIVDLYSSRDDVRRGKEQVARLTEVIARRNRDLELQRRSLSNQIAVRDRRVNALTLELKSEPGRWSDGGHKEALAVGGVDDPFAPEPERRTEEQGAGPSAESRGRNSGHHRAKLTIAGSNPFAPLPEEPYTPTKAGRGSLTSSRLPPRRPSVPTNFDFPAHDTSDFIFPSSRDLAASNKAACAVLALEAGGPAPVLPTRLRNRRGHS